MSISKYSVKNVATVKKDARIEEAIEVMKSYSVDNVVVVEIRAGKPYPMGHVTSCDIFTMSVKSASNYKDVSVKDVMSDHPVTCEEGHGIQETINLMQKHNLERLPVVDELGALVGLITASDLFEILSEEFSGLTKRKGRQTWRTKQSANPQTSM